MRTREEIVKQLHDNRKGFTDSPDALHLGIVGVANAELTLELLLDIRELLKPLAEESIYRQQAKQAPTSTTTPRHPSSPLSN